MFVPHVVSHTDWLVMFGAHATGFDGVVGVPGVTHWQHVIATAVGPPGEGVALGVPFGVSV